MTPRSDLSETRPAFSLFFVNIAFILIARPCCSFLWNRVAYVLYKQVNGAPRIATERQARLEPKIVCRLSWADNATQEQIV